MSLERGNNSEKKEVPEVTEEKKIIQAYAQALRDLEQREGVESVENLADSMVGSLQEEAKKLKFQISQYGEDRSWAMFGLAQAFYNFQHPESFPESERSFLVDPMEDSPMAQDMQRDLVHRELAREARREYRENAGTQNSWRKFVDETEAFELAYEGLRKEPENPGEKIKSDELVELGAVLSRIGTNLEHQSEEYETPSISEIIPPGANPEPQKLESPPALIAPNSQKSEVLPAATAPEPQKSERSAKQPEDAKDQEKASDNPAPESREQENRKDNADSTQAHKKHADTKEKNDKTKESKITVWDVAKAGSYIGFLFPLIGAALAVKELYKTGKESIVGMFGVLKKTLAKGFAGLNAGVGAAPSKPAAHKKEDHGEKHAAADKHDAHH